AINNIPLGMLVKSGSTLLVPRQDGAPAAAPQQAVDNARLALAPAIVLKRLTVHARSGDTIARVAARYDLPAATVAGWNRKPPATHLTRWEPVTLYLPVRAVHGYAHAAAYRRRDKGARADRAVRLGKARAGRKKKKK
ncbi:MAG: lytic transglycosylase, partial [Burkholderiaceae bacterium]|nr:lytic transglycosylase [Burkholderiaceae bacterium]